MLLRRTKDAPVDGVNARVMVELPNKNNMIDEVVIVAVPVKSCIVETEKKREGGAMRTGR